MHRDTYLGMAVVAALGMACSDDDTPTTQQDASVREADAAATAPDAATDAAATQISDDLLLPIVFVHGYTGSAQQFTSDAMRFVANGYPSERLRAYEHDGVGMDLSEFVAGADAVIDEVREQYGVDKVFLIGHSRGTSVSSMYLGDPARAEKVAKYVAEDGGGCASSLVPCIAPAQTTNTRPGQTHPLEGQRHVEVATSKESFAAEFEFFFGKAPEVLEIVKQREPVEISGRAVNVPSNTGREGALLDIWELDAETGQRRAGDKPLAHAEIPASGDWGPVTVDPDKHYEFVLSSQDSPYQHHFYEQPFLRSSQFIRLRSGPPDSPARMNSNLGDDHSAIIVSRMREWTQDDVLEVSTETADKREAPKNIISEASENRIAIYLHDDAATPGESSLELLPWFPEQAFQTGVDLFMPASEEASGTITLRNLPRGDEDHPQVIRIPNWPSTNHNVSVMFSDFPH